MDVNERVDALLGEAVRSGAVDAEAQRRAVAAFRSSWGEGGHRARTRRRDDWRPRGRRRTLGSLRASVGAVLASLLLGGVAIASIASSGTTRQDAPDPARESPRPTHPSPAATAVPSTPVPQRPAPSSAPTNEPTNEPSDRASAKGAKGKGAKGNGADKDKKKGAGNAKGNARGRPTDSPPKASKPRGKN